MGLAAATILAGVTFAGCSADKDVRPHPTPTASSSTPLITGRSSTADATAGLSDVEAELQAYLDAWRTQGPAVASRAYLATDQQLTDDTDAPHLKSGTVIEVAAAQPTADGQVFTATLELAFDGDPIAWSEGRNDRFVAFTWRGGDIPFAMSFATGP